MVAQVLNRFLKIEFSVLAKILLISFANASVVGYKINIAGEI